MSEASYAEMIPAAMEAVKGMTGGSKDSGGSAPAASNLGQAAPEGGHSEEWFKAVEGLGDKHPDDHRGL